jgi:nucleoside phosphorylase
MAKMKEAPALKSKKAAAIKSNLTQDDIAARAYEIYLERGATPGDPMQDWLRAERELAAPPKKSRSKSKVITLAA